MKKIAYYFLLATVFLFISCSGGDDSAPIEIDTTLLKGIWTLDSYSGNISSKSTGSGVNQSVTGTYNGRDYNSTLEISETQMIFAGSYRVDLRISASNGQSQTTSLYINYDDLSGETIDYTLDDNIIDSNVDFQGFKSELIIQDLTETSLIIDQKFSGTIRDSGITSTSSGVVTFEYSK